MNDQQEKQATKGDSITIPLKFRLRQSDKLYKIVKTEYAAEKSKFLSHGCSYASTSKMYRL